MTDSNMLPVNFTISPAAKNAIALITRDHDALFPHDPAALPSIGWGSYYANDDTKLFENVVLSFYRQSQRAEIAHGIQKASELELIFFITEEHHPKFAGKVLDHTTEGGFFLRNP